MTTLVGSWRCIEGATFGYFAELITHNMAGLKLYPYFMGQSMKFFSFWIFFRYTQTDLLSKVIFYMRC